VLSPFSYAVMAVVGRDGASGSELVEMASGGAPFFWTGASSHVLRTARRLADAGYLSAHHEPATTRPRTIYHLTDKGHAAFRDWLAQPSSFPRIQHEAAIRLWSSDLGNTGDIIESLRALKDELPRLEALVQRYEQRARTIPHRTKANLLALSLARRLLEAHQAWIDDVEAAYSQDPPKSNT
jgi:PadR family transcriptional regulator, regulatory protein AphA